MNHDLLRLVTSKSNFSLTLLARQLLTTANYRCYFESLGQNGRVYTLKVHIGRGIDFKVLGMGLQIFTNYKQCSIICLNCDGFRE
jgi:hypothetical protein